MVVPPEEPGAPFPDLGARRFFFVTGKGGVGKTTVAGALALALGECGRRVLVAMCNTKERLSAILGVAPIGDEIVAVGKSVWAVNIDPAKALEEYGGLVLKVRAVTRTVFHNKYTKTFFRAVPGLYEWATLGKAWWHTTETAPDGSPRFDVVLLDAPATGHGLDMLRVPKVILDVVPPGALRRDAHAAWDLFRDARRSGVLIVTLAEEMPTTETIELASAIEHELTLPVVGLVINGVLPQLFSEAEAAALTAAPELLDWAAPLAARGGESALVAGARRAARERVQRESLEKLRAASPLPRLVLPALFEKASTAEGTRIIARRLRACIHTPAARG